MKLTESLCPICYQTIPALIYEDNGIMMQKQCRLHGVFTSMVERDVQWYNNCIGTEIYNGYLIDVTSQCNIKCKYCFHDNKNEERTVESIVEEAKMYKHLAPFVLTGGEPTLHSNLVEVVRQLSEFGEVNLLTNGIELCNEEYLDRLLEVGLVNSSGVVNISLSLHEESCGKDLEFLELCRKKRIKIWTCLYVIDSLDQISQAVELFKHYADVSHNFRIKAASNLWEECSVYKKLFTSDILKCLVAIGETEFQSTSQKVSYAQVIHQGLDIRVVSWYDVDNVDLWDINCPPYYRANDGTVNNFVTTAIVNEGIEKRKINVRRASPCDINRCGDLWVEMVKEEKPDVVPSKEIWCDKMFQFIQSDRNHLYVGEVDGKIVSFVSGCWDVDPLNGERYILGTHFYVQPEFRKHKIGKMLHNKYINVGKKLGVSRVVRQVTQEHSKILLGKGQELTEVIVVERI